MTKVRVISDLTLQSLQKIRHF